MYFLKQRDFSKPFYSGMNTNDLQKLESQHSKQVGRLCVGRIVFPHDYINSGMLNIGQGVRSENWVRIPDKPSLLGVIMSAHWVLQIRRPSRPRVVDIILHKQIVKYIYFFYKWLINSSKRPPVVRRHHFEKHLIFGEFLNSYFPKQLYSIANNMETFADYGSGIF